MIAHISKNGVALVVLIATLFGLDVPQQAVEAGIEGLLAFISLTLMIWNQITRRGVKYGLWKE